MKLFFHSFNIVKPATVFANFPVNKHPSTSEVICHFQEAARLFPNCFNKQGIRSNLPSYTPMNQGTICAKVYPEGFQPIKGNNCGLIPPTCRSGSPFFKLTQNMATNDPESVCKHFLSSHQLCIRKLKLSKVFQIYVPEQ